MASVADILNRLAAGDLTLDQAAADFRARTWPKPTRRATVDEAQRGDDPRPYDAGSWDAVSADSRLTADQYARLADAYRDARRAS